MEQLNPKLDEYLKSGDKNALQNYLKTQSVSAKQLEALVREICAWDLEIEWVETICSAVVLAPEVVEAMIDCGLPVGELLVSTGQEVLPVYLQSASDTDALNDPLRSLLEYGEFSEEQMNAALSNTVRRYNFEGVWLLIQAGANPQSISEELIRDLEEKIRSDYSEAAATYLLIRPGQLPFTPLEKMK